MPAAVSSPRSYETPCGSARLSPDHGTADPESARFTPPVGFFSSAWAAVRGVRSLETGVPTAPPAGAEPEFAFAADEASVLTAVRLTQLQGPEEIPVLKPCACMTRARTMHPGRSAHVKVGFATSICNFGAEGAPTAPVRVHVAPATGSTPNAPLRSAPLGALHHGARWWESGQIAPSGEEERGGDEEPPDGDAALHVSPGSHTLRNACSRCLQLPPVALSACPRLNHEVGIAL